MRTSSREPWIVLANTGYDRTRTLHPKNQDSRLQMSIRLNSMGHHITICDVLCKRVGNSIWLSMYDRDGSKLNEFMTYGEF